MSPLPEATSRPQRRTPIYLLPSGTSAKVRTLDGSAAQLTLRPSRANYYELGVTKEFFHKAHVSANVFQRDTRNFADDDVLLDTGVSFP